MGRKFEFKVWEVFAGCDAWSTALEMYRWTTLQLDVLTDPRHDVLPVGVGLCLDVWCGREDGVKRIPCMGMQPHYDCWCMFGKVNTHVQH